MDLLSVIRRWRFREKMAIREIERRTGLSRNTIRKYQRAETVEPQFKVPKRPSKLDPFAEKLSGWLRIEAGKSRKQKRTAKQMHADLVALGYDGSYARVATYVRGRVGPYARAGVIAADHVGQPRAIMGIGGAGVPGADQAFRVLGGVPRRGIFDNMKTAVDRIGVGKARQVNARFAAMASHYLFEPEFCNPASGWEKGQVEKNVQDARRRLWQRLPSFPDIHALNAWLEDQCIAQWGEIQHGGLPGTVADVHAAELDSLMPLGRPFDGFVEHTKRV